MEIEFKQEECKNKENMYQVGNVIEYDGSVFLLCQQIYGSGKYKKYFFISLRTGIVATGMYNSLEDLRKATENERDRLVKAKLIIDHKLDEDAKGMEILSKLFKILGFIAFIAMLITEIVFRHDANVDEYVILYEVPIFLLFCCLKYIVDTKILERGIKKEMYKVKDKSNRRSK